MSDILQEIELYQQTITILNAADPEGFDPSICGSEDRCDVLTTLRTLATVNEQWVK